MRLLLISLIIYFGQNSLYGQMSFDEVEIYFYPEVISSAMDQCDGNENNTRVRASVHISIKQKAEIQEIEEKLLGEELSICPGKIEYFTSHMVVDFVKSGRIKRTIAISALGEVRKDEDDSVYFFPNERIRLFYNNYLIFFRKE